MLVIVIAIVIRIPQLVRRYTADMNRTLDVKSSMKARDIGNQAGHIRHPATAITTQYSCNNLLPLGVLIRIKITHTHVQRTTTTRRNMQEMMYSNVPNVNKLIKNSTMINSPLASCASIRSNATNQKITNAGPL